MSKRTVRLTESDLHKIIKESVKKILKENEQFYYLKNNPNKKYTKKEYKNILLTLTPDERQDFIKNTKVINY